MSVRDARLLVRRALRPAGGVLGAARPALRAMRPALRAARRPLLGLLVAGLVLLGVEGILRVLVREVGQATIPSDIVASHVAKGAMRYHEELGWTWSRVPEPSLGINADGFRYAELPHEKPAGTIRAFSIGDSQTFGAGLDAPDSWPAVAEARVRAAGHAFELVNAATAGYGSLQALRLLETKLLAWDPDLLIIDCRTFDSARETRLPRYVGLHPLRALLFESRLYYALRLALREAGNEDGRRMTPRAGAPEAGPGAAGAGNHDLILERAGRLGIEVVFVDYPLWAGEAVVSRAPAHELPAGATVVPATAALLATGLPPAALFFDNNHLTVEGARIVGESVGDVLLGELGRRTPE